MPQNTSYNYKYAVVFILITAKQNGKHLSTLVNIIYYISLQMEEETINNNKYSKRTQKTYGR